MKQVVFNPSPSGKADVRAVGYLHEPNEEMQSRAERPCVVFCPGGGFDMLSNREAEPPAMKFFALGYQVFILYYSIREEAADLNPLAEISEVLISIRGHAAEWNVLPDKIAVCGFSAGGHVAASTGTLWNSKELQAKIDTKNGQNRPNAMILCYPVLTAGEFAHRGSINWLGRGMDKTQCEELLSLEKHVVQSTPPTFLWHTVDDDCVPVENSLLFAAALQRNHVPFECHLYQSGCHGLSVCNNEVGTPSPHCKTWIRLCTRWLGELFQFTY